LFMFWDLRGEFKDLVKSFATKAWSFLYADFHSHLLTYEFLHKTSLQPIVVTPSLLPTLAQPPSTNITHHHSSGLYNNSPNFSRDRGWFHGSWHSNKNQNSTWNKSDFHSF
jgi:hypothetical protein